MHILDYFEPANAQAQDCQYFPPRCWIEGAIDSNDDENLGYRYDLSCMEDYTSIDANLYSVTRQTCVADFSYEGAILICESPVIEPGVTKTS